MEDDDLEQGWNGSTNVSFSMDLLTLVLDDTD